MLPELHHPVMLSAVFVSENSAATTIMRKALFIKPITATATTHKLRYTSIIVIIAVTLGHMSCIHTHTHSPFVQHVIKSVTYSDPSCETPWD